MRNVQHPSLLALSVLICAAWAVWTGCDYTVGEHPSTLSGTVVDSTTGVPLDSAWVALDDSSLGSRCYTDSMGAFTLLHMGGIEEEVLFAGKPGYLTRGITLTDVYHSLNGIRFELPQAK